ncbi:TRAP transporter substrate-binding protein [Roseivivax sp. CAU 1761]
MATALLTGAVAQAETVLKISHFVPAMHGIHRDFIVPWTEAVSACAGGDLRFEIAGAGSQLGHVARQQEQVMAGIVDIAHGLHGIPRGRFPRTSLIDMPFLTEDAGAATYALWQLLPDHLAEEYRGLKVLALHAHNGGLIHTRGKAVETMEDLRGLRIRTPSPAVSMMLDHLGATPQGLPPGEVYESLQRGVLDGAVFPWDPVHSFGLNEVLDHHLETGAYTVSFFFVMNQQSYDRLDPALQACIDAESGDALVAKFDAWWDAWDAPGRAGAEAARHEIVTLSAAERERWRAALDPMVEAYLEQVEAEGVENAREIYRALQEKVAEYEAGQG